MKHLYHLNSKAFTKEELISYCEKQLQESTISNWENELYSFILEWLNNSDSIKAKTSGSTGQPKDINLLKCDMKFSALKTVNFFKLTEGHNALLCLPVSYIAGKMMVVRAFEAGLNLVTVKPESTPDISGVKTIDFAAMTPYQVKNLLSNKISIENIKQLIIGGGPVDAELNNSISKTSIEAYETYGMTETMSHVALRKITGSYPAPFQALPGVQFSTDKRNCLRITVDFLSKPIQTNDIVELISETSFIYIGRDDFIINSGGIKINPEEIESHVKKVTGIDIIVSSIPDEKYGKIAILILMSQISDKQLKNIQKYLASNNSYRFIKNYTIIENIPNTASGKTDRIALSQMLTDSNISFRTLK